MAARTQKNLGLKKNYIFGDKELQTKIDNFSIKLDTPEEKQSVIDLLLNILSIYSNDSTFRLDSINGFEQKMNEIISTLTNILINGEEYLDSDSNINIEHPRLKLIIDILDNNTGDVKNFFSELNKLGYIKNATKELQELQVIKEHKKDLVTKKRGGAKFFDNFKSNNGGHHFFIGVGKNHRFIDQSQGLLMFTFDINDQQNEINKKNFNDNQKQFFDNYDNEIKNAFDEYENTTIGDIETYQELHKENNPENIAEIFITKKIDEITEKYKTNYDNLSILKINGSLRLIKKITTTDKGETRTKSEFIIGPFDADLELNMSTHKIANLNCNDFNLSLFKLFCGQQKFFDNGIIDVTDKCYCFRDKLEPKTSKSKYFNDPIVKKIGNEMKTFVLEANRDDFNVGDFIIKGDDFLQIYKIIKIYEQYYFAEINSVPTKITKKNITKVSRENIDKAINEIDQEISIATEVVTNTIKDVQDAASDLKNKQQIYNTAIENYDKINRYQPKKEEQLKKEELKKAEQLKKANAEIARAEVLLKVATNNSEMAINAKNKALQKQNDLNKTKDYITSISNTLLTTVTAPAIENSLDTILDTSSLVSFMSKAKSVIDSFPKFSQSNAQPPCIGDLSYFSKFKEVFQTLDKKLSLCSEIYSSEFDLNSDFIAKPVQIINAINSLKLSENETQLLNDLDDYAWEYIEDIHVSDQISTEEGKFRIFSFFSSDQPIAFFSNSCEIIYNSSNKTYSVIPRDIKMPTDNHNIEMKVNKNDIITDSNKLIFRDGNVFFNISTHTTGNTSKSVSEIDKTNDERSVTTIFYKDVAIITDNRPVDLQFFTNEIIKFKINNENDKKFKDIQDSNRGKLFINLKHNDDKLSELKNKYPYDKDSHDTTMIGIFIFICILYAFYLFVIAPLLFIFFGWAKSSLLAYLMAKFFGSNLPYGNFLGLGNFFQMSNDISTDINSGSTLIANKIIVTLFSIAIAAFSGFFKLVNQTYALNTAPYATKYLFSSFITSKNQLHKLLHDHFNKLIKTQTLKNVNIVFKINDENPTAAQILSNDVKEGDFFYNYNNNIKSINGADPTGPLKILYYLIFSTGLWKIVLVFLIMATALNEKVNLEGVYGGKLSRKAKNNKKTKKPKFLKRSKKTLRRRKISGGGNTVDIENMKNLTGITYFLLSAFSGYYSSFSSIPVPKFMFDAVKVFLKL